MTVVGAQATLRLLAHTGDEVGQLTYRSAYSANCALEDFSPNSAGGRRANFPFAFGISPLFRETLIASPVGLKEECDGVATGAVFERRIGRRGLGPVPLG